MRFVYGIFLFLFNFWIKCGLSKYLNCKFCGGEGLWYMLVSFDLEEI